METTVLFNPYNPINKYIDKDFLESLLGFKINRFRSISTRLFINLIVKVLNLILQIKMVKK